MRGQGIVGQLKTKGLAGGRRLDRAILDVFPIRQDVKLHASFRGTHGIARDNQCRSLPFDMNGIQKRSLANFQGDIAP